MALSIEIPPAIRDLCRSVLTAPGTTDMLTRETAYAAGPMSDPVLDAYLEKVRSAAYKVADADIRNLRDRGFSEDAIFELTVAAALGAAARLLADRLAAVRTMA